MSGGSHPVAVIRHAPGPAVARGVRYPGCPAGLAGADDGAVGDRAGQLAAFCVVANVAEETASGEGGLTVRAGARHFAAGAKVWVLPPQWGDGGDQLIVAGHHRGTRGRRGLARMVMPRRHLTGFRVQGVYSPAVIRALTRPLTELGSGHAPRLWATRQQARPPPRPGGRCRWRRTPMTGPSPPPLRTLRRCRSPARAAPGTWRISTRTGPSTHRTRRQPNRPPANPGPVSRAGPPGAGVVSFGLLTRSCCAFCRRPAGVHNLVRCRRGLRA